MDQERKQASTVKIAKPFMDDQIIKSVNEILNSGFLVQGKIVKEFEQRLAEYLDCKYVVAVNSGTAALHIAIETSKLGGKKTSKDFKSRPEVITSPLSFAATANAAMHAGCRPVFADIDENTFNLDPSLAEEKVSERTIAIEPVDVYGLPADLASFAKIAESNSLTVVEDAAEAIGAKYAGKKIGSISDLTCFSTYATKNLHTGEGGFVSTNDPEFARSLEMLRSQGQSARYKHQLLGYNYRMLEFVAAIGLSQVRIIDELNERRRQNALLLKELLSGVNSLKFQEVRDSKAHSWYMFAVVLDEEGAGIRRDSLVTKLREEGIEADVSWPTPIHLQPFYRTEFGFREGDYPNAEKISRTVFQLPIQPFISVDDVERTAMTLKKILNSQ